MSEERKRGIHPLGEWLIVQHNKRQDKMTKAGIIIPDTDKKYEEKLLVGTVLAVGPGKAIEGTDNIFIKKMTCKKGDVVLYSKYLKGNIDSENPTVELHNVKDGDVVAIIK